MLSREEFIRINSMTDEEKRDELLRSMSDSVRKLAKHLAMIKAMAYRNHDIKPEDFDIVFNKEMEHAWNKVKDKNSHELTILALGEVLLAGSDLGDIFGTAEEEE